jgi:DNA polymerase-1
MDCAGQELRILTEYSQEPSWLEAFRNDQDLHSISGEMLSPESWRKAALLEEKQIIKHGKVTVLPPCAYYTQNKIKCDCPEHEIERDKLKGVNFGVAYDKQAYSLGLQLGISKEDAELLLRRWHSTFKITSNTLKNLRETAYSKGEARDLAGRRRYAEKVTYEQAKKRAEEKYGPNPHQQRVVATYEMLMAAVKRELGNMPIQGSGATLMKRAMGCGFDSDGKPYMWHQLEPDYGALLSNFVYDEFLVESPEEHGEAVSEVISDAIIRAGAEFVKSVPMKSTGAVSSKWTK